MFRRRCRPVTKCFFLWLLLSLVANFTWAQSETATVSGQVLDPSGLKVASAQVKLVDIDREMSRLTATNNTGFYTFPSVKPGRYRIEVSAAGFRVINVTGITVNVQDQLEQNFKLVVGSVAESMTVEAKAGLVDTQSAAVSTVVDRNFVENLPLNGRSFNTLMQLTPGVVLAPSSGGDPGQFSIGGQRTDANSFQVDGVSANFGVGSGAGLVQSGNGGTQAFNAIGGTSSLVSVDDMQEFRVQTSSFAPEYGRTPGGQVSISTRSGTNQFHGGIFEYFRNDVLDANNWFNTAISPALPKAAERQNDFGGYLGGPIIHDKTFVFLSFEQLRLNQPATQVISVPSLALRGSALSSAMPYLNAYPTPNGPVSPDGTTAQETGGSSNPVRSDAASIRLDSSLGQKVHLFGRFSYAPSSAAQGNFNIQTTNSQTQTSTFGFDYLASSSLANSARFNYSRQRVSTDFTLVPFAGGVPPPSDLLIPQPFSTSNSSAFFESATGDIAGYALGTNALNRARQLNVVDDVSVTAGLHQLKFGIDYNRLLISQIGALFNPLYLPLSAADFASSGSTLLTDVSATRPAALSLHFFSAYAQDSWKATRRLTLTYGARWEFNPAPSGSQGTTLAAWTNVNTPATTALAPAGTPPWKTTYGNFAPRLGIAYSVSDKQDLVLRAGWGIFYDLGTGQAPGLLGAFPNSVTNTIFGQSLPISNPSSLLPPFSTSPPYPSLTQGVSPDLQLPYSYEWNVAVEKAIGHEQAVSVTYVGQLGERLLRFEVEAQPNSNFVPSSTFGLQLNGDTSNYQALQLQYKRPMSHGMQALANYTWSHCIDTGSSDTLPTASIGIVAPSIDRGPCDFDVRQSFSGTFLYLVPASKANRVLAALTGGWTTDLIVAARTGLPVNVESFASLIPGAQDQRPDVVPGQPIWIQQSSAPGGKVLNPAAFVDPSQPRQGDLGRNAIEGFGLTQIDFSAHRTFALGERVRVGFQGDVFNILNHPNFSNPNPFLESATFGRSTSMLNEGLGGLSALYQVGGPRSVQFSLRLTF
jgi:hypothetical protein